MKLILALLTLIPTFCFSQNFQQDGLWKGYVVQNQEGEEIKYKRQDFVQIKGDSILLFQFQEKMSMETGEIRILTVIDTLIIGQQEKNKIYQLSENEKLLTLKIIEENEFQIVYPKYILTFKRITDLQKPATSINEFEDFISGATLIEIDPTTKETIGNLSRTYQSNGKVRYQQINSKSNWESEFLITDFEGYVFLKGITSAPIILTSIDNKALNGIKVDYRFDPQTVNLVNPNNLNPPDSNKSSAQLPFEIKVDKISIENCISKLSKEQLNLKVNIAKGITEKQIPTIQVQHSYGGSWMLFHEEKFDGFAKTTVKELLKIDPSLCYIFEIPSGYYAERNTKDDEWYIYLHEERFETDTSFIIKKAFRWNNTYRVINEMKGEDLVNYEDYYLDTRVLRKTWSYREGKEVGITCFYDKNGRLEKEINNDN